jgi:hypothetical protein
VEWPGSWHELDSVGFTAIFAYASVAAMDAILHIFREEYDAQYDAASAVCIYMTILATVCLDWTDLEHSYYPTRWLWMLLLIICVIPTFIRFFKPCFSMIGFAKAFPLFVHGMFQVVFLVAKDFREIFR